MGRGGRQLGKKRYIFAHCSCDSLVKIPHGESTFCQLDNSGNSAISVKGKALSNVKMYIKRNVFFFKT